MPQDWQPTRRKRASLALLRVAGRAAGLISGKSDRNPLPERVGSILVLELWNIGDLILAMPFLAQLRALFPGARVALVARPLASQIMEGTGLIDELIPVNVAWTPDETGYNPFSYRWRELATLYRAMRGHVFDLGFSCRLHLREQVILALSRARRRIGFAFGSDNALLTDAIQVRNPHRHKTEDWLALLEPFGGPIEVSEPRLQVSATENAAAEAFLAARGIEPGDRVIGIHPGASLAAKRWPLERFIEVARALVERSDTRVIAFVDPGGYGSALAEIPDVVAAKVSLRELIALIEQCDLLLCIDSGPMHIAGALGTPTVGIFGAGIDRWFSPLGEGHEFVSAEPSSASTSIRDDSAGIRSPAGISIQEVLAAVDRVLQRPREPHRFSEA